MNLRSRSIAALAVAVVSLVAMHARAQQRSLDLTRFVPPLDAEGFLGVQSTAAPGAGRADTVLTLDYAWRPLIVTTADGRVVPIIEDRLTADVGIQVGIGGRLALGLAVPLVLWQSTNGRALDGQPLPSVAAGDPRLSARYRILGESASVARERHEGPGLALAITGWLPAGQTDAFLGEGALRLAAQVLADFQVLGAGVGGVLGFRHRFERRYLLGERYSSELELGLALKLPIPVMRDFSGLLELHAITDAMKPFGAANTSVETSLGCRIVLDDLAFTGSIGLGLTGGVGTPAVRSTLAVAWAPRTHDRDTDTVPDDSDECPPLPEDFDGFEDEDGCPDPDNDDDMVLDQDDQCPTETAEEGRDEDEDGCTDPFVDADADGITDTGDACPQAAEDRDEHDDDDGCPDLDDDEDGVPDADDRCPTQAEDRDGFEDDDGCADPDDDGDGIGDADDRCPRVGEDRDGHDDDDGCPDLDDDADGVPDATDACLTEPETVNGLTDDDGCPDRGGRVLWRATGAPAGADARLVGALLFDRAGALAPGSAPSVEQLARILRGWQSTRKHWQLAIAPGVEARVTALRAALVAGGLPAENIHVTVDPSVRGAQVVVSPTSAPPSGPTQ